MSIPEVPSTNFSQDLGAPSHDFRLSMLVLAQGGHVGFNPEGRGGQGTAGKGNVLMSRRV